MAWVFPVSPDGVLFCRGGIPPSAETLCFGGLFIMAILRIPYACSCRLKGGWESARADDPVIVAAAWRQSAESSAKTVGMGVASHSARTGVPLRAPEMPSLATLMTVLISIPAFYGNSVSGARPGDDFRARQGAVAGETTGE